MAVAEPKRRNPLAAPPVGGALVLAALGGLSRPAGASARLAADLPAPDLSARHGRAARFGPNSQTVYYGAAWEGGAPRIIPETRKARVLGREPSAGNPRNLSSGESRSNSSPGLADRVRGAPGPLRGCRCPAEHPRSSSGRQLCRLGRREARSSSSSIGSSGKEPLDFPMGEVLSRRPAGSRSRGSPDGRKIGSRSPGSGTTVASRSSISPERTDLRAGGRRFRGSPGRPEGGRSGSRRPARESSARSRA